MDWDSHRGDKCQSDVFLSGGELQVQPTGRVHARESRCADDGESKLFELIGGCEQIEAGPLGLLGSSSSQHRRTPDCFLSDRISPPCTEDRGRTVCPLGHEGSSNSRHRRTLELVLQKGPTSFQVT